MKKRRLAIFGLTAALLLSLNGCGNGKEENITPASDSGTVSEAGPEIADTGTAIRDSDQSAGSAAGEAGPEEMSLEEQIVQYKDEELAYDQVIFNSDQVVYSIAELREMPDQVLAVFRNELYARHGRIFRSAEWKLFFSRFTWYEELYASEQFNVQEQFSDIEKENLKLILSVEAERDDSFAFTPDNYPRVDGSTATIPLSEQYAADAMGLPLEEAGLYILHTKTHNAYVNLIEGKTDIIFVTAPSEEELQLAEEAGIKLEVYPVVKEAFVFLVNERNPVKELTQQQILDIYSGKLTNWHEVGGEDQEILPYQRPVNSGSQSGMLSLVMKDVPIMKAPSEYYYGEMDGLVEAISTYDNAEHALGYSYYYYVSSMYFRKGVRLLAIDGVAPEAKSIQDDSYPYTTAYYAVIKGSEPKGSNARKLLDWIEQKGGQSAEAAGYVPLR